MAKVAKLTKESKEFALYELAAFASCKEVVESLKTQFDITISPQAIWKLEKNNPETIEEYRDEILARMNTKLAYRAFRVERWALMADEGRKDGDWKKEATALNGLREEMAGIEGTQARGTAKKAIEYVQSIGFGSGDPGCVQ